MSYERLRYLLVALLALIAGLYLVSLAYHTALSFSGLIFLYFTAWLISFLLSPAVEWLCDRRFPRLLAVAYVYVVLAALIVIMVLAVVPTVVTEAVHLTDPRQLAVYQRLLTRHAQDVQSFLVGHTPLPKANIVFLVDQLDKQVARQIKQLNTNLVYLSESITGTVVSASINIVQTALNWLLNAVIILVLSFYMTLDGKRLTGRLIAYLPASWASEIAVIDASIARSFGGYIRGQVFLGVLYGLMTYVTLIWFHTNFAVVLAIFAGIMMLIPFVGTFLAVIPPLVVAGLQASSASQVLWLAAALIVWQQVTLQVLAPRILGGSIGLHPLLVFLGILLGTKLAGPWGAIFGVPVLGVLLTITEVIYRRLMVRHHLSTLETSVTTVTPPDEAPLPAPPVEQSMDGLGHHPVRHDENQDDEQGDRRHAAGPPRTAAPVYPAGPPRRATPITQGLAGLERLVRHGAGLVQRLSQRTAPRRDQ